eukprot:Nitzschia sp. Nitz4//scaffold171_size48012//22476//24443//NITZ4_007123-RA/size48012-snap-gene-0.26-mRNA-1//-1//CDS//3329538695//6214//frame0
MAEPVWDPVQQIYVGGVVPENAKVQSLIKESEGSLRLFGYGSLCWHPGAGVLSKPGVQSTLGRARGYRRCWAQKSTDHRGRPPFPGIVCTLLEDNEVWQIKSQSSPSFPKPKAPTLTEGMIFTIPPDLVEECLEELDFREKGGYARDVIEVIEDKTGETHHALLYRGTPDNPAFWPRVLMDLPLAAAVMAVSEGPSGLNEEYLFKLDHFLTETHTIEAENDDTTKLAAMTRQFQQTQLFFLFGSGSNQHNQLLLDRPENAASLVGEDAHDFKEIVFCNPMDKGKTDPPVRLFAGGGHSGMLTQSGKLYLWGWNEDGQCGRADGSVSEFPLAVVHPVEDVIVKTAALGFNHTLFIEKGSGRVLVCGSNERGQVDGSPSGSIMAPTTPSFLNNERAVAVGAGLFHSVVATEGGELFLFGCSQFGQSLHDNSAVRVGRWKPSDGSSVIHVACGRRHTAVVDDRGRVWTFGENKYGQLGRGKIDGKFDSQPTLVADLPTFPVGSTVRVECGWSHTVVHAVAPSGESVVYGWGRNDRGQLGLGTTEHVFHPQRMFSEETPVVMVAVGSEFTTIVGRNGDIMGCGWNEHGNLAKGTITETETSPGKVVGARVVGPPGLYNGTTTIAAGGSHVLAAIVPN